MPYDEQSFLNGLAAGLTATATYPKCNACVGNHIANIKCGLLLHSGSALSGRGRLLGTGNPSDMIGEQPYVAGKTELIQSSNAVYSGLCEYVATDSDVNIQKCGFFVGKYKLTGKNLTFCAIKKTGGNCCISHSGICPCGKIIDEPTVNVRVSHTLDTSDNVLNHYKRSGIFWNAASIGNYDYGNNVFAYSAPFSINHSFLDNSELFPGFYRNIISIETINAQLFFAGKGDSLGDLRTYIGNNDIFGSYPSDKSYWSWD